MLVLLVGVAALDVLAPTFGPFALTAIFEPYVLLGALPLLPLAWRRHAGRLAAVGLLAFTVVRYVPVLVSVPPGSDGDDLRVASWNLHGNAIDRASVIDWLAATDADVVAIQELSIEMADALAADARVRARYPTQVLYPRGRLEMGILSRLPLSVTEPTGGFKTLEAELELPGGRRAVVLAAHPLPGLPTTFVGLPVGFDSEVRDEELIDLRRRIDRVSAEGLSLIVIGDLNATEREPVYSLVAGGLLDAHLEVGLGPGSTWRTAVFRELPVGVLRIDYVLTSPELRPTGVDTDCSVTGSDHCRLVATLAIP